MQQKLFISLTVLTLGLIVSLLLVVESRYRTSIKKQVEKRGATIAEHLAAVSRNPLLTYDHVALWQDVKHVSRDSDVLHTIILQRDGKVAIHSEYPELRGQVLDDAVSQNAIKADRTLAQYVRKGPDGLSDHYDVATPIIVPNGVKWGTVRVGLSLHDMHVELRKTRLWIVLIGGLGGALSLMAVAKFSQRAS